MSSSSCSGNSEVSEGAGGGSVICAHKVAI